MHEHIKEVERKGCGYGSKQDDFVRNLLVKTIIAKKMLAKSNIEPNCLISKYAVPKYR